MKNTINSKLEINNSCEEFEWDDAMEEFNHLLRAVSEDLVFYIEGRKLGWRNRSGHMFVDLNSHKDFFQKVFPNTDWSAVFELEKNTLNITLYHHDSPCGEFYTVVKADLCAVCGDPTKLELLTLDEQGNSVCNFCKN